MIACVIKRVDGKKKKKIVFVTLRVSHIIIVASQAPFFGFLVLVSTFFLGFLVNLFLGLSC